MVKGKLFYRENKSAGKSEIIREGTENKERIFDFIYGKRAEGVKAGAIIKSVSLSKETVHKDLRILLKEKRIYKKDTKYYPVISIRNEFSSFGHSMREGFYKLIDIQMTESAPDTDSSFLGEYPRLNLHQKIKVDFPTKLETRCDILNAKFIDGAMYLMKMMIGPVTSEKYCHTDFGAKESLQKCLFEFSNRVGAYISYVFLQSLHPLQEPKLNDKDRNELSKIMIEKAILLDDLFMFFRYLLIQLGLTDSTSDANEYEKLSELSENNFNAISKGLQNVYSNLYIGLENWWLHSILNTLALDAAFGATSTCMHEWEKIKLFKYGSAYYCKKCNRLVRKIITERNTIKH